MDKAEYRIKLDQINKLADAGDYKGAASAVDDIDWKRVKSVRTLCMVAEIYEANNRLEDSQRILKIAYRRSAVSKTVLYRLTELAIKLGNYDEAMDYYTEFAEIAPNDSSQYILKYKLYKARKSPIEDQIEILEEYKSREYTEKWAYELAKLYNQAGMKEKCVEECDDIILWFSEGTFVNRAMELKLAYGPLSPSQQKKYEENRFAVTPKETSVSAVEEESVEASGYDIPTVSAGEAITKMDAAASTTITETSAPEVKQVMPAKVNANALNLQSQLADSIRAVFAGINNKGVSVADLEQQDAGDEEDDVKEYVPEKSESISEYEVKDLEPEVIGAAAAPAIMAETKAVEEKKPESESEEQIAGQMSLADLAKEKQPEELDLDALFAETKSALAQQVATGEYIKTEEAETTEPAAEETVAEPSAVESETQPAVMENAEAAEQEEPNVEEPEEAEETISLEKETDETLGLTREFNFHQELQKAIVSGKASAAAADILRKNYEEEKPELGKAVVPEQAEVGSDEENLQEELDIEHELENQDVPDLEDESKIDASAGVAAGIFAAGMAAVAGAHVAAPVVGKIEVPEEGQLSFQQEEAVEKTTAAAEPEITEKAVETEKLEEIEEPEEPEAAVTEEPRAIEEPETTEEPEMVEEPETLEEPEIVEEPEVAAEPSIEDIVAQAPDRIRRIPIEPRPLDEVEKKVFSYFAPIPGMSQQITEALCDIHNNAGDKTSKSGNILITGRQGSGKTRLAEGLIQASCRDLDIKAAKIAKVIAEDLNKKDLISIIAKLSGGFLIIEGAGGLSDESVAQMVKAMEFRTDGLVVILEDEKPDLKNLLNRHPELAELFTSSITIPVFTNDELVSFAKTYVKEQGYKMDEMAVLALYTMIGDNQKDSEPVAVGLVKDMVDTAIHRANRGTRKLGRKFSKKSVDEENRIILFEKDFDFD